MTEQESSATHVALVLLQHGSHGNLSDFEHVKANLLQEWQKDLGLAETPLEVWQTPVNSGLGTDHGLVVCGAMLAKELRQEMQRIQLRYPSAKLHLSCLGHSFGGLILRQALWILDKSGDLKDLTLVSFVTLASPHVGIRQLSPFLRFGAWVCGVCGCSRSYRDLLLKNQDVENLCRSDALAPLKRFRSRALYASIKRDHLVPFETAGLALPAEAIAAASSPRLEGYTHVREMMTLDPPGQLERDCSNHSFDAVDDVHGLSQKAVQMLLTLRGIGRWSLYPVNFPEWNIVPHGAIIQHPNPMKNPNGGGEDVALHAAELICADAACVILLDI